MTVGQAGSVNPAALLNDVFLMKTQLRDKPRCNVLRKVPSQKCLE